VKIAGKQFPVVVDRATFQAELDALQVREKAHSHQGDAIAAARRRLPMVEVDSTLAMIGLSGLESRPSWQLPASIRRKRKTRGVRFRDYWRLPRFRQPVSRLQRDSSPDHSESC